MKETPFDKYENALNDEIPTNRDIMRMLLYMHKGYQDYKDLWESPFWLYVNEHILTPELKNKPYQSSAWGFIHKHTAPVWFTIRFILLAMIGNALWDLVKYLFGIG